MELGYVAGYTASDLGKPEVYIPGMGFVPYGPGSFIPNSIYCNVGCCLTGEMEKIAITTQYDIESRKELVRFLSGMSQKDIA